MTRRRVFDPGAVPVVFWRRTDVQDSLAHRDVGRLFGLFLDEFSDCTQTQLALLTQHDRSDISNWVRGTRQGRVSDIEVLTRIADGLQLPDQARLMLGLAPLGPVRLSTEPASSHQPPDRHSKDGPGAAPVSEPVHIAICGSRAPDTDASVIDATVGCLARLVMSLGCTVSHGPVGVGIEVMTYIADQYRPPEFDLALGRFGHRNVIQDAEFVVVLGGAAGTQSEIDLALSMGKKVIALPSSGGTARRFYHQAARDQRLRAWMSDEQFAALNACVVAGEDFVRIVEHLITKDLGAPSD
ncbi:hypothetical protein J4573_50755 [Actinomadura barringtoniae]|uniref:XRE family transcriptional regulator n=1 Tax=Actinomadura barringtoniae TaxID=1427535 RepID=A0A939T9R9_9ACTN|nr:hypothetical protein [Actinomadura barringtoniae]MBO2455438.1 hypothetical protein [Actinomadura barringtoniae]